MIWNDDKINRLMSMGMLNGQGGEGMGGVGPGAGDPGGGRAGEDDGADAGDAGAGGDGGGLSGRGELSVDLGGGVTVGLDPDTGDVTSTSEGAPGGLEGALSQVQEPSAFGQFISNLSPAQFGAGLGVLAGTLAGIGPLAGAIAGARLGAAIGPSEEQATQGPPGGFAPGQAAPGQAATTQAPGLAGVSLGGQGLQVGPGGAQLGGEGQALQVAAAGRQSGLVPAQQAPQFPQLGALQERQFLNRQGPLPTVNLQAFPGAIGRIG